ncbi:MAG: tRNA-dihydrouridine synthase [Rhodobacteraceae bacterium]|nr:tRNA-dihydrouridine synthase [Paracoccaceae bacterium]
MGLSLSTVAAAGCDFIHLASEKNGYAYHSSTRDGENLTALARRLTGLPIIANGGLEDIDFANEIITSEKADLVSIGKAAMLNPDLPKLISSGRTPEAFTFDMFKYGVTIDGQRKWEAERADMKLRA